MSNRRSRFSNVMRMHGPPVELAPRASQLFTPGKDECHGHGVHDMAVLLAKRQPPSHGHVVDSMTVVPQIEKLIRPELVRGTTLGYTQWRGHRKVLPA